MFKGNRKLILGVCFMACSTFLIYTGIKEGSDLLGLSTTIGGMSVGVGSLVWGNIKEHEANRNEDK